MKKLIVFATVVFVAWYWAFMHTNGIEFTLKNVGTEALRSVTVELKDKSYVLGDVAPGTSKTVKINPLVETHRIDLRLLNGRMLTIDCYISEKDSGGRIKADVTSEAVITVKDESTLPSLF
jgi:hypothetical protein